MTLYLQFKRSLYFGISWPFPLTLLEFYQYDFFSFKNTYMRRKETAMCCTSKYCWAFCTPEKSWSQKKEW